MLIDHRGHPNAEVVNCTMEVIGKLGKLVIGFANSGDPGLIFNARIQNSAHYKWDDYEFIQGQGWQVKQTGDPLRPVPPTPWTIANGDYLNQYQEAAHRRGAGNGAVWYRGQHLTVPVNPGLNVYYPTGSGSSFLSNGGTVGYEPWSIVHPDEEYTPESLGGRGPSYGSEDMAAILRAALGLNSSNDPYGQIIPLHRPDIPGLYHTFTDGQQRFVLLVWDQITNTSASIVFEVGALTAPPFVGQGGTTAAGQVVGWSFRLPNQLQRLPAGTKIHEALVELHYTDGHYMSCTYQFRPTLQGRIMEDVPYGMVDFTEGDLHCRACLFGRRPISTSNWNGETVTNPSMLTLEPIGTISEGTATLRQNTSGSVVIDITNLMQELLDTITERPYYDFVIVPVPQDIPASFDIPSTAGAHESIGIILKGLLREKDWGVGWNWRTWDTPGAGQQSGYCFCEQSHWDMGIKGMYLGKLAITFELDGSMWRGIDFRNWPSMRPA